MRTFQVCVQCLGITQHVSTSCAHVSRFCCLLAWRDLSSHHRLFNIAYMKSFYSYSVHGFLSLYFWKHTELLLTDIVSFFEVQHSKICSGTTCSLSWGKSHLALPFLALTLPFLWHQGLIPSKLNPGSIVMYSFMSGIDSMQAQRSTLAASWHTPSTT